MSIPQLTMQDITLQNAGARHQFLDEWLRNAEMNRHVPYLTFKELDGQWRRFEVILVGASPSLEQQVDILKRVDRKRFKIVAVDVIFKYLVRNGIIPDCVAVADSQNHGDMIYRESGSDVCDTSGILMLACAQANHPMLLDWNGPRCLYLSIDAGENPTWKRIYERSGVNQGLSIGGNVATAAYSFCTDTMECKRLIMLGQEHSWKDFDHRFAGQEKPLKPTRLSPALRDDLRHGHNRSGENPRHIEMRKNYLGEKVYTDHQYLHYAKWLEKAADATRKSVFDCSIGGLLGAGVIPKRDAATMLLQPFVEEEIDREVWYKNALACVPPDIAGEPFMVQQIQDGLMFNGEPWTQERQDALQKKWFALADENSRIVMLKRDFRVKIMDDRPVFKAGVQHTVLPDLYDHLKAHDVIQEVVRDENMHIEFRNEGLAKFTLRGAPFTMKTLLGWMWKKERLLEWIDATYRRAG